LRVLYFTKYTRQGASSRLRSYQYFPYLEEAGFSVTVLPLFSDRYLEQLYRGKVSKLTVLSSYFNRLLNLFKISSKTKIVIEKELFPYMPAWAERLLALLGIKYIVDYDDAIFHNYDKNPNGIIRFFLKHKIDRVMRHSKCVIAGNSYLAKRAQKAGAKCIRVIPTVIDLARYQRKEVKEIKEPFIIGWIGSPSTFKYMQLIAAVLEELTKLGAHIHVIGAKGDLGFTKNVHFIEWEEASESQNIAAFDVGIMPLEETPWEKGKCSYKLIQYMACGLPVIASPVGMNKEVVKQYENGFLANTQQEWLETLKFYKKNAVKRKVHGDLGYSLVEKNFTINSQLKKLIKILIDE
jgi:glycosyltransferase involved in cell wall biosynthesis